MTKFASNNIHNMKTIYSPTSTLARSIIAIAIGVVLIIWPEKVKELLVTITGILLLIPSLIILTPYLFSKKTQNEKQTIVPITAGVSTAVFGLRMILYPEAFVSLFTIIIGIMLTLAGITQVVGIYKYSLQAKNYWIMTPSLIILMVGVVTILNFKNISNILLIIIGVTSLLYGLSEVLNYYKIRKYTIRNIEIKE